MGWCSGSDIYDPIEKAIISESSINDEVKVRLLRATIKALQAQDWDCESDSFDPSEPVVVEAFGLEGLLEPYESHDVFDGINGSMWTFRE